MFLGDTHGSLGWQKNVIIPHAVTCGVDLILQLGDHGHWWPGSDTDQRLEHVLADAGIEEWFIDGNHDNHPRLQRAAKRAGDGPCYLRPHIRYLRRGERFELDGLRFLALGGAYSIDQKYRIEGHSWWREEQITYADALRAIEGGRCDVILTHDKPLHSRPTWNRKAFPECLPNQKLVQEVIEETRPKWCFHGHLHHRYTDMMALPGGHMTRVEGLNCDGTSDAYVIKTTNELRSITRDLR